MRVGLILIRDQGGEGIGPDAGADPGLRAERMRWQLFSSPATHRTATIPVRALPWHANTLPCRSTSQCDALRHYVTRYVMPWPNG